MDEAQIDSIGLMLEDKGLSHSDIDEWFAHHGVKGMKWGVRRALRKSRGKEANRTKKQKAAIAGAGLATWMGVGRVTPNNGIGLLATAGATALGVRAARNILDERGSTRMRDLSN